MRYSGTRVSASERRVSVLVRLGSGLRGPVEGRRVTSVLIIRGPCLQRSLVLSHKEEL